MNQEEVKKIIGGGVKLKIQDKLDFSHSKVFGKIPIEKVPNIDFRVAEPLEIKDQRDDDTCVAQATTAVLEDSEGVPLDAYWFFKELKKKAGNWQEWGATIKDGAEVAVSVGCIESKIKVYMPDDTLVPAEEMKNQSRDYKANWNNWPNQGFDETGLVSLSENAEIHQQKSYFKPDGYQDTFSSFRAVLWQNKVRKDDVSNRERKLGGILTGCLWRQGWIETKDGIIPTFPSQQYFGHSFKFLGQKIINNEPYLEAQLSNGKKVGTKGIFLFNKEVINRDFIYEAFLFEDMPPEEARKKSWNCWQKVVYRIRNYFNNLME